MFPLPGLSMAGAVEEIGLDGMTSKDESSAAEPQVRSLIMVSRDV